MASSVTSTKQFVRCNGQICEERDGSGSLSNGKQFFALGQVNFTSGTPAIFPYTLEHLGNVREMTNSSGVIQAQYAYGPWGETTKIQGSADADRQFTGLYAHARSGLLLSQTRAYNPALGRWISRDPIAEAGGVNLYAYQPNNPISFVDPDGTNTVAVAGVAFGPFGVVAGGAWLLGQAVADIPNAARRIHENWEILMRAPDQKRPRNFKDNRSNGLPTPGGIGPKLPTGEKGGPDCKPPAPNTHPEIIGLGDCQDWCEKNCLPGHVEECKKDCEDQGYEPCGEF